MEVLVTIKKWASELANVAVSLMALAIVLELLFGGSKSLPFLPVTDVIGSVTETIKALGSEGLVGLVAVWVLYSIWNKK
jgi:ABC-type hemin transport system substrate-binding protein